MGKTRRHEKRWGSGKRPISKVRRHNEIKNLCPKTLDHVLDDDEFEYLDDISHDEEAEDKYRSKH